MPVVIKDFEWTQTDTTVTIAIPLKGVPAKKVDIYSNDSYVKAHYPPYFFELDLFDSIDYEKSNAAIGNGYIRFTLVKTNAPCNWPSIHYEHSDNKEMVLKRREQSFAAYQKREAAKLQAIVNSQMRPNADSTIPVLKQDQKWIQKQIDVQNKKREELQARKAEEKQRAERDVNAWKEQMSKNSSKTGNESSENVVVPVRQYAKIKCTFTKCEPEGVSKECLMVDSMPMRTKYHTVEKA